MARPTTAEGPRRGPKNGDATAAADAAPADAPRKPRSAPATGASAADGASDAAKPAARHGSAPSTAPAGDGRAPARSARLTLASILNALGRTLIGAGVVILLFVVYQLWGTNLQEARSQSALEDRFADTLAGVERIDPDVLAALARPAPSTSAVGAPESPTTTPAPPPTVPRELVELLAPSEGAPVALLRIPKIGVEKVVVHGTSVQDLRDGPGHYAETPLPGQKGNAAIAGHRTTYGAPFHNIDQLRPGDRIEVDTVLGSATYVIDAEPFIVQPEQVEVLDDQGDNRLTLTSCHPKFSAAQRMIVTAKLEGEPLPDIDLSAAAPAQVETFSTTTTPDFSGAPTIPVPATTPAPASSADPSTPTSSPAATLATEPSPDASTAAPGGATADDGLDATAAPAPQTDGADLDQGLGGDRSAAGPAFGWGLLTAFAAVGAWWLGRFWKLSSGRRAVPYLVYLVASPVVLSLLYVCFEHVDRLLPAY